MDTCQVVNLASHQLHMKIWKLDFDKEFPYNKNTDKLIFIGKNPKFYSNIQKMNHQKIGWIILMITKIYIYLNKKKF